MSDQPTFYNFVSNTRYYIHPSPSCQQNMPTNLHTHNTDTSQSVTHTLSSLLNNRFSPTQNTLCLNNQRGLHNTKLQPTYKLTNYDNKTRTMFMPSSSVFIFIHGEKIQQDDFHQFLVLRLMLMSLQMLIQACHVSLWVVSQLTVRYSPVGCS